MMIDPRVCFFYAYIEIEREREKKQHKRANICIDQLNYIYYIYVY